MPSWIILGAWLSLGVCPTQVVMDNNDYYEVTTYGNVGYYSDIGVYAEIGERLTLSGSTETYMMQKDPTRYSPYRADFTVTGSIKVTKYVTLTVTHECVHQVVNSKSEWHSNDVGDLPLGTSETKIFATIGTKPKF